MVESLWRDVRTAVRSLMRSPGFSLVALLTLALGIGVNTVVFSVIHTVLLEPLPYPAPHQLVVLWTTRPADDVQESRSAWANVEDWRAQARTLADVAVHDPVSATLGEGTAAERVVGVRASPSFFSVLGAVPGIGRTFTAQEAERGERVVVLSHELWRRRFGADPAVLGDHVVIDGAPTQVVGVMPADFRFMDRPTAFWEPHTLENNWHGRDRRGTGIWQVLARLRSDASPEEAQIELDAIARRLEEAYPAQNRGVGVRVVPLHDQWTGGQVRTALWALWGAVGFVLLIACANVANLLLARGAARRREMAIRTALGAGRSHLVRQVLTESVLLSLLGGGLGTGGAIWSLQLLPLLGAGGIPRLDDVTADGAVLGFSLALALLVGVVFGVLPAFDAARPGVNATLNERGRSSHGRTRPHVRRGLVITELALAVITLMGAGLLGRSLIRVLDLDLGFEAGNVLHARISLPPERSEAERVAFYSELFERMEKVEGVEAAGAINDLFVTNTPDGRIMIEGRAEPLGETRPFTVDDVTPGFFRTIRVPLLRGRMFTERDRAGSAPVVLINESMARRFWPGIDPIGQRLQIGRYRAEGTWLTVIGIVADFRRSGPEVATRPQLFVPFAQNPSRSMTLLVRTVTPNQGGVLAALRAQVAAVDPTIPLFGIATLEQQVDGFAAARRFQTRLLTGFSVAALVLAAIGIFGLISQSVNQRAGEIGARMALGATQADILRLVIREVLFVTAIGLGAGLAGGLVVGRLLRSLLFEVAPTDPVTLIAVCLVLVASAMLSCSFPALRASRLDPVTVLRRE